MPETLAERIAEKYFRYIPKPGGCRAACAKAIQDFARELAGQIRAEKTASTGEFFEGVNAGKERAARIVERAAGGEG